MKKLTISKVNKTAQNKEQQKIKSKKFSEIIYEQTTPFFSVSTSFFLSAEGREEAPRTSEIRVFEWLQC